MVKMMDTARRGSGSPHRATIPATLSEPPVTPPPVPPTPPAIPPQVPFKSAQQEFGDEQNRTISGLSDALRAFAFLLKILGAVFAVLLLVAVGYAVLKKGAPPQGQTEGVMHVGPWGDGAGGAAVRRPVPHLRRLGGAGGRVVSARSPRRATKTSGTS